MKKKSVYILIALLFSFDYGYSQISEIVLGNNIDLVHSISLSKQKYSLAEIFDGDSMENYDMVMEITNKSMNSMKVFGPIHVMANVKDENLEIYESYYTYNIEKYDCVKSKWIKIDKSSLINFPQYLEESIQRRILNQNDVYKQRISVFLELNISPDAKYRIQSILTIKSRDSVLKFPSNVLEVELSK